jgi:hypothetical protein
VAAPSVASKPRTTFLTDSSIPSMTPRFPKAAVPQRAHLRVAARLSAPGGRRFRLAPRTPGVAPQACDACNSMLWGNEGPAATARVRTRSGSPVPQSRA